MLFFTGESPVAFAQTNSGELRLKITDPDGLGLKSTVELTSESNQLHKTLSSDDSGIMIAKGLPFGIYKLNVHSEGFAPFAASIDIRSAVPTDHHVTLAVAAAAESITVHDIETLIDPYSTSSINRLGSEEIDTRLTALPGRSIQELVNSQPGWLYEGNAVLHPRGSEYQTQFVVDGIPLTDNRSPSFGPEIEASDVQSMSVYTAGIPAEYGRKMGGVIEVNTARDIRNGLHGQLDLSGGSFDTAGAYGALQYGWGKNTIGGSASGGMTDHYLNPPVVQNYTNTGTTGDFSVNFDRDLTERDRLGFLVRHELSRFLVPNEQVQQAAGQRQDRDILETMGMVSYQHTFSSNILADLRGMVRDDAQDTTSNEFSTPIIFFQNNGFREGYFKGTLSVHRGRHEWKAGVESDAIFLNERFNYKITDFSQFDPDTPPTFSFTGNRPDLEQSAFIQDQIRLGNWSISAGLRWDHYQLLVNQNALSPRVGVGYFVPKADLVLHASYDRVFQTPEFENILLSSSTDVVSLSNQVLRLPVEPSHGDYFEVGITKGFLKKISLDINYYNRRVNNFADDDQLLDTAISFPIAFRKANIYGAEGKVNLPHWGNLSGFVSYSYMVSSAFLPVTGGLFLGDEATSALDNTSGRFWVSQDQRNTLRTRFRYEFLPRLWGAAGVDYGSGLPFEFTGTEEQAIDQFGQAIVDRVDFTTGRVKPSLSFNISGGADLYKKDKLTVRLQGDVQNLNNGLNLIDFAGLFSGSAIAPPRSYALRLQATF